MKKNLSGKHFLKLADFTNEEILHLVHLSKKFKKMKKNKIPHKFLDGKNIVLLFEKTSTRTRCSFEVASNDLGINTTFIDCNTSQLGHKESIEDTGKVLSKIYDGIEYRGFSHSSLESLAKNSTVPVWNGLTDTWHPTQIIGDLLTIYEHFGYLKNLKLVFIGDTQNNVANSLLIACTKLGINFVACGPKELHPNKNIIELATKISKENSTNFTITEDIDLAIENADIIYTDVWFSMGDPQDTWKKKINLLKKYQVNSKLMSLTNKNTVFLHCLPAFHDDNSTLGKQLEKDFNLKGLEVTDEIFNSPQSLVFEQSENRMHSIKAIIYSTLV